MWFSRFEFLCFELKKQLQIDISGAEEEEEGEKKNSN